MAKMTEWFPPSIQPVHKGVYRTRVPLGTYYVEGYSLWDGFGFGYQKATIQDAKTGMYLGYGNRATKEWCGLSEKPNGR